MQTDSEMKHGSCRLHEGKMGEATSARFCVSEISFRSAFLLSLAYFIEVFVLLRK